MDSSGAVSVIVVLVNYNSLNDTNECIFSLRQSGIKPFVVLVDNASKNSSSISAQLTEYEYGLHVILLPENIGFGRANNAGIDWAAQNHDADYIFLLNNDTIISPDTIEKLIEPFGKYESIGLTTCKIVYKHNPSIVWYGGGDLNIRRGKQQTVDYNREATAEGADKSRYVTFASGCAMMFNRESLQKIGGFDKMFFMYVEDLELCMRVQQLSLKIWYTAKTTILHKVNGSTNKVEEILPGMHPKNPNLKFYTYHMIKNMLLTMDKHLSGYYWVRFIVNYSSIILYKNLTFLMYGRFDGIGATLKAYADYIKEKKMAV